MNYDPWVKHNLFNSHVAKKDIVSNKETQPLGSSFSEEFKSLQDRVKQGAADFAERISEGYRVKYRDNETYPTLPWLA